MKRITDASKLITSKYYWAHWTGGWQPVVIRPPESRDGPQKLCFMESSEYFWVDEEINLRLKVELELWGPIPHPKD